MRTLSHTGGGTFIGNPITYAIDALNLRGRASLSVVAFHRVVLHVEIGGREYEFSESVTVEPASASDAERVEFDIASAFRSAAESQQYQPLTTGEQQYEVYHATLYAYDVWVEDGTLMDRQEVSAIATCDAIAGAFSDFERLHPSTTATASRKPATGELVIKGDGYVRGSLFDATELKPKSTYTAITAAAGATTQIDGRKVYVCRDVPAIADHACLFQFVNSRGLLESITSFQWSKEDVEGETKTTVKSIPETFTQFSRKVLTKSAHTLPLSCSSGFVTYEWARWWAEEFCMSEKHWMLGPDNIWVPCQVKLDGKTTLIDSSKSQLCSVQFVVTFDLNGALW